MQKIAEGLNNTVYCCKLLQITVVLIYIAAQALGLRNWGARLGGALACETRYTLFFTLYFLHILFPKVWIDADDLVVHSDVLGYASADQHFGAHSYVNWKVESKHVGYALSPSSPSLNLIISQSSLFSTFCLTQEPQTSIPPSRLTFHHQNKCQMRYFHASCLLSQIWSCSIIISRSVSSP
jgi:hypothetical protein